MCLSAGFVRGLQVFHFRLVFAIRVTYSFENGNLRKYSNQNYSKVWYCVIICLLWYKRNKDKEMKKTKIKSSGVLCANLRSSRWLCVHVLKQAMKEVDWVDGYHANRRQTALGDLRNPYELFLRNPRPSNDYKLPWSNWLNLTPCPAKWITAMPVSLPWQLMEKNLTWSKIKWHYYKKINKKTCQIFT